MLLSITMSSDGEKEEENINSTKINTKIPPVTLDSVMVERSAVTLIITSNTV